METPQKVLFHDQRVAKQRGDGTSIPQIQLGTSQLEREEKGEMVRESIIVVLNSYIAILAPPKYKQCSTIVKVYLNILPSEL